MYEFLFQIEGWMLISQGWNKDLGLLDSKATDFESHDPNCKRRLTLFETQQFSNVFSYRYRRPLLADDSVGMLSSAFLRCRMSPWGYKNPRARCRVS